MGVPGLSKKLAGLKKTHGRDVFFGADIYIDLLNVARIANDLNYEETMDRVRKRIKVWKTLNPHSITFVTDAIVSLERVEVRENRRANPHSDKARVCHREYSDAIAEDSEVYHVYAGNEAENEIMKLIDEDQKRGGRTQIVISDDSDLLRFEIRDAHQVEIMKSQEAYSVFRSWPNNHASSLNLGDVIRSKLVPRSLRIKAPIERPGLSFVNAKQQCRHYIEMVNCGVVYNRLFARLTSGMPTLLEDFDTSKFDHFMPALSLRRIFYALVIRNYFKGKIGFESRFVEETCVIEGNTLSRRLKPLEPTKLGDAIAMLRISSLMDVVCEELDRIASHLGIRNANYHCVAQYVDKSAQATHPLPIAGTEEEVDLELYFYLWLAKKIVYTLGSIEEAVEGDLFQAQDYSLPLYALRYHLSYPGLVQSIEDQKAIDARSCVYMA